MSDHPRKTRDEYELVVLPPLDTAEYHSPQDETLETAPRTLAAEDTIALGRTSIAHALPTPSAEENGPSVGRFTSAEFSALRNVSWSPMDLRGEDEVSQKLLDMYSHVNALGYEGERRGSRELLDLAEAFFPRFDALSGVSSRSTAPMMSLDEDLQRVFADHGVPYTARLITPTGRSGCYGVYRQHGTAVQITASPEAEEWLLKDSNRRLYCAVEGDTGGPHSTVEVHVYPTVYVLLKRVNEGVR